MIDKDTEMRQDALMAKNGVFKTLEILDSVYVPGDPEASWKALRGLYKISESTFIKNVLVDVWELGNPEKTYENISEKIQECFKILEP